MDSEESKYAARVLRLPPDTEVELYNGLGEVVGGRLSDVRKSAVTVKTTSAVQKVSCDQCS